jgi:protocatechuate 3,4-dioxygenase beta subunit
MSNTNLARRGAPAATALLIALALSACGGGGGNPGAVGGSGSTGSTGGTGGTGTTTPVAASPTVTLGFVNASGASTNALTGATPLTVKATVLDKDKKPVPSAIVSFATDNTLAVFSPSAGTALTDVNGVASVTMRVASLAAGGAAKVTASTTVAGSTITGESNYSVGATTLSFGAMSAAPNSIQAYGSTVLSVDVLAGSSKYTEQQVNVSFSSACVAAGKATLAATVATNNGTAQTVYRDKGCANNDVITVSADGIAKSATAQLQIAAPAAASVQFVQAAPSDKSIVIRGQGGNGRTETATLSFKVVDIFGNPLAGKQVNFAPSTSAVTVNKLSDTTDATGSVVTTVNSGSTPTSFRVLATLPGTASGSNPDISTYSDSIVVTTGLPVQRAFSLSSGSFNVEGWNIDNPNATSVQVMLADAFGNPVPDGTPVVFQTNMGAIGSSDKGGCNTVNGLCSVLFRSQNPRTATPGSPVTPCNTGAGTSADSIRPGLATICASSSDGSNTVFAKTAIFMSGSGAVNVTMSGAPVSYTTANDLGALKSSETKVFQLQLNDVNNNPMPAGTRVELTSVLNATAAAVLPATVPNIAPHAGSVDDKTGISVSGPQGSFHTFSISSTTPTECKNSAQASFNVAITTPGGTVTAIPFKLLFTCP